MITRTLALTAVLATAATMTACTPAPAAPGPAVTTPTASIAATPDPGRPTPSISPDPDQPATLIAPVIVLPEATEATAGVGDVIVFDVADPLDTTITATPEGILDLVQGSTDGSATFNPGAAALTPGVTTVMLTDRQGPPRMVKVTVTAAKPDSSKGQSPQALALCDDLVAKGVTLAVAEELAKAAEYRTRVGSTDGVANPVTRDYNPQRLTFDVTAGTVTGCTIG